MAPGSPLHVLLVLVLASGTALAQPAPAGGQKVPDARPAPPPTMTPAERKEKAKKLAEEAGIKYNLGLAHEMIGDLANARTYFEDVYVVDVTFRDVSEKVRRLAGTT